MISFINIFGLSIGIAFSILVFLFVKNEYSFDRFHKDSNRIYRIMNESIYTNRYYLGTFTPMRLADDLYNLYPEIEKVVRIARTETVVRDNNHSFREEVFFIEKDFLSVFSFPILKGSRKNPIKDMHSIIISKEMAKKYFRDKNPIGKRLNVEFYWGKRDFLVTAVFEKKANISSHLKHFSSMLD